MFEHPKILRQGHLKVAGAKAKAPASEGGRYKEIS